MGAAGEFGITRKNHQELRDGTGIDQELRTVLRGKGQRPHELYALRWNQASVFLSALHASLQRNMLNVSSM